MRKLIAKLKLDGLHTNVYFLNVYTDEDEGTVDYRLTCTNSINYALSNMQCGWRGPLLPDNIYEHSDNENLLGTIREAVNGGVYTVQELKLFVKN